MRERSFDDSVKMRLSHIIILLAILQFLFAGQALSQPEARSGVRPEISSAIGSGDTEGISRFFNDRVEITINNVRDVYSLTQAKFVMKKFFTDFPPSSPSSASKPFDIAHYGNTETTVYALGAYKSPKGEFEVNIFIKRNGDDQKIDRIRFEGK